MISGFELYQKCRCGGVYQEKYRQITNHSNKYIIFPSKSQFRLIKNNLTMGVFPTGKIEEKLREYAII